MLGDEAVVTPARAAADEPALRRRIGREFAVVAAVIVVVAVLGAGLDLFDVVVRWDDRLPGAHLGDVLMFVALSHVVMVVFGARRGRDLRRADLERRARAQELAFLAHHDPLTGLLNRAGFADRAATALTSARRDGRAVGVVLVDLDRFREINDTLGHHVGDDLLAQAAARLREHVPLGSLVARLGGDEFAVLLDPVPDPSGALEAARNLRIAFTAPLVTGDITLEVGVSAGLACSPDHGDSLLALLRRADAAISRAKAHHTGVEAYEPAMDSSAPERVTLYGELRRAIDRAELVVHYQPQVGLHDRRVRSVEALVRWEHPTLGPVPPSDFLPLAEQTGLIRALTSVVLAQALDDVARWRAAGQQLTVAVNLSVDSLRDRSLPDVVADLLATRRLDPGVLEVEVTESVEITGAGDLAVERADVLGRLRRLGVRVAVDDYGTGYSSLSYLSRLPVDVLKIDQSFVRAMDVDAASRLIVRSTVELARSLGLRVVAEGVETERAWHLLTAYGCDLAQGYWLARPGPASAVPEVVARLDDRLAVLAHGGGQGGGQGGGPGGGLGSGHREPGSPPERVLAQGRRASGVASRR